MNASSKQARSIRTGDLVDTDMGPVAVKSAEIIRAPISGDESVALVLDARGTDFPMFLKPQQRINVVESGYVARFYVMRRANIVFAAVESREDAERMERVAKRQHPRDRVRIIETLKS